MRMVIFRREKILQMELYGLLDNHDARILYQECLRLVEEGHTRLFINLSRVSRLSDQVFEILETVDRLFKQGNGSCTFVASQPLLKTNLQQRRLSVQSTEVESDKEVGRELQSLRNAP